MIDVREGRPFFGLRSQKLREIGLAAISKNDIEATNFAVLEARRRSKTPGLVEELAKRIAATKIPLVPWLEGAYEVARRFRTTTEGSRNIYVVLLARDGGDGVEFGLYVGMTSLSPEERFQQHRDGYKSSKYVHSFGVCVMPRLYSKLADMSYSEAMKIEADLAEAFQEAGIWTEGGH